MRSFKFKAGAAGVALVAVAVLTHLAPALAVGAGEGGGVSTGFSNISSSGQISTPLCIKSNASPQITLNNQGTLGAGATVYNGASQATFTLATFYYGPEAAYAGQGCPNPPGNISLTGNLTTPDATTSCSSLSGTYTRVTNAYNIKVTGNCTIKGVSVPGTTLVFSGNENPCLDTFPVPVPDCTGALDPLEFQGTYSQAS